MEMCLIGFKAPLEVDRRLRMVAAARRVSKSDILREIVVQALEQQDRGVSEETGLEVTTEETQEVGG